MSAGKLKSTVTRRQAIQRASVLTAGLQQLQGNHQMLLGAIGALVNKYGRTLLIGSPPSLTLSQEDLSAVKGRKLRVSPQPDGSAIFTLEEP